VIHRGSNAIHHVPVVTSFTKCGTPAFFKSFRIPISLSISFCPTLDLKILIADDFSSTAYTLLVTPYQIYFSSFLQQL